MVIVIVDSSWIAAASTPQRRIVSEKENQVAELLLAPAKHLTTSPGVNARSHQPRISLFLAQSDVGSVTAQNQVLDNVALFRFGDIECSLLPSKFSSRQL